MRLNRQILFLVFLTIVFAAAIQSQTSTATLKGKVVDQAGASVFGAIATVTHIANGTQRSTASDESGNFVFPFLPPAQYRLRVRVQGFATADIPELQLNSGQQADIRVVLKIGDINETVIVKAIDSPIRNDSPALGAVVGQRLVENLPLNGRSFQSLVALAPGVIMTRSDTTNQGQFSVNGQRQDSNYFTVDGVGANFGASGSGYTAGGTVPATNAVGSTAGLVPLDAVQELNIQTSTYAPEYGRGSGGQISVTTRSGTNKFRGSVFEYFRNDALDANDWFANSRGLPKGPLRHNDFGGVFGGPLIRERAFFFVSYEGLRLLQPRSVLTRVPSIALRQSAPAAMQPYLNAFPLPNGAVLSSTRAELYAVYSNPRNMDSTGIRVDYIPSSGLTFFGRFNYAPSDLFERRSSTASALSTVRKSDFLTRTLTLGSTQVITQNLLNEARVNFSISRSFSTSDIDNYGGAVRPSDSILFQAPYASVSDSSFGFTIDGAAIGVSKSGRRQNQLNVVNNLSFTHGKHHTRIGIDYRRLTPVMTTARYSSSIMTTGALIANSKASRVTISRRLGDLFPIYSNFSAYVQDQWTPTDRLSLTYGVRWDLNPPPSEKNGNLPWTTSGGFDPNQMVIDTNSYPFWKTRYTNFAPRVGAAYRISSRPGWETVLRGGFGVFYDVAMGTVGASMNPAATPFTGSKVFTNVTIPLTEAQAAPPAFSLNPPFFEVWKFDPNLKTPRTYEWSFGTQQALGSKQTLSVSYVAAAGRNLISDAFYIDLNPDFFRLHAVRSSGSSDYRSVQIALEKRTNRGVEARVAYTLGNSKDTSSTDSAYLYTTEAEALRAERGPSDFDVRHNLTAGVTYNFPNWKKYRYLSFVLSDWSVSSILSVRSAMPIAYVEALTTTCEDDVCFTDCESLANSACPRPDLVPGVPVYLHGSQYPGGMRLNPTAFRAPPAGRQGILGRNALRGFPAFQIDLSLRRSFKLSERFELQFTAEGFNIFNHPNFANPFAVLYGDPVLDERLFGVASSMLGSTMGSTGSSGEAGLNPIYQIGSPRSFQFAIRLKF